MRNVDGLPSVQIRTPADMFAEIRDTGVDILTWQGELVCAVCWVMCWVMCGVALCCVPSVDVLCLWRV